MNGNKNKKSKQRKESMERLIEKSMERGLPVTLDSAMQDACNLIIEMKRLLKHYNSSKNRLSHIQLIVKFNILYFKAYVAIMYAENRVEYIGAVFVKQKIISPVITRSTNQ